MQNNSSIGIAATASLTLFLIGCGGGGGSDDETTASNEVPPINEVAITDCGLDKRAILLEVSDGDLSNDPANPTPFILGPGINILGVSTANSNASDGDIDYAVVTVGPCDTLDQLSVGDFTSEMSDMTAFVALQSGATFTVTSDTASTRLDELLGYSHYGSANIAEDILPAISAGPGAIGFTAPLPAGQYSFWLNQTGPESTSSLLFHVSRVIEP